jgi:hypothetical protein
MEIVMSRVSWLLLGLILLVACRIEPEAPPTATQPALLASPVNPEILAQQIPALVARRAAAAAALQTTPPILLLPDLTGEAAQAQTLALQNSDFLSYAYDLSSGAPLRNEIMVVRPALPSDLTNSNISCTPDHCYRVELYNYAQNVTTVAFVDAAANQVAQVSHQINVQPEIPPALADLAVEIARHAPEVQVALWGAPGTPVMPNVKTALNGSQCERSRHLCVAPTFIVGDRALWAIVDLTDEQLVGIRWTELGASGPASPITERGLENEVVYATYCQQSHTLSQAGWEMSYMLTSSDGLKLTDVRYQEQTVLNSATLVDWHVSYSQEDGFGYSDAIGCPIFSSAAVVAFSGPAVEEIVQGGAVVGFALVQDFRSPDWPVPCNYRYEQRYEFYTDGRFRVTTANRGRGCGNDGTYRPVLRLDITASDDGKGDNFAEWDGQNWQPWSAEGWQRQDENTPYTPEGYQYRLTGAEGQGFYVEPGQGQFGDSGRGDNAFVYITVTDANHDEGKSDLATLGACCNTDYQQGPEAFITPAESALEQDLVLWYVPQLKNEDTPGQEYCWADTVIENGVPVARSWPCYAGPMFVPIR